MKNLKKILASLLVVVMVLTAAPLSGFVGLELPDFDFGIKASALSTSGYCGPNVTYTYNNSTGELVISGEGPMTDFAAGYYDKSPFFESYIKSVVIEDGVTSIGDRAFFYCYSLTSVTIPDSVTTIGYCAFYDCDNLTSVTIPNSVTTIGNNAFYSCDNLISITIGDSVTTIGSSAFCACSNLTSVTIPDGVTIIGDYAFSGCKYLETINIPNSVTFVGIEILKNTAWFNCRGKGLIVLDGWAYGYKGSDDNVTITFDETVKNVADEAFKNRDNIVAFEVDENNPYLLSENNVLFSKDKTELFAALANKIGSEYIVPDTVEVIHSYAFYNCNCLRKITIPASVKSIGTSAFYNKYNYDRSVYITDLEAWCNIDFADYSANPLYIYSSNYSSSKLYINGFAQSNITIPDTITEFKPYAFYNCDSLTSITIGDSVTTIGESAFDDCDSLTNVTLGDSVTTIGYCAFYDCDSLISITLCKAIQNIGYEAFDGCSKLRDVFYPGSQKDWDKVYIADESNYDLTDADLFLMHNHDYVATTIKKVTCTENGEILYTCKLGDSFTEVVPALGHNWVDLGGSVKATCTTNGIDNYKCSNCGEEKKGTTPAFDHDWEYIENTYATCTEDGYMSRFCLREGCGVKEEEVTPASHNLDWWDTKEPTCTESGAKYIGCLDCSYSFAEAIPANGHTYYWKTIKNATCTTEGLKEKRCEWCSDMFETETIPVEGHTYSEWVELLPATCSERGLNIKICNECNDIQRQIIPKIAHIDDDGNGVCDNCESTYNSDATDTPEKPDAPEEPDTPEVPDTPDIPDEPEEEPCDCDCHAGGIKAFFFNFLNFFAKLFNKDARTCECGAEH